MHNIANQVHYLRTSREFPEDLHQLTVQVNKSYVEIALAVNDRIIGIFSTNKSAVTGESWFLTSRRQQTLRQVYQFTSFSSPLSIPHGIIFDQTPGFTRIYGTSTDGTKWYPLPYVDVAAVNDQINIVLDSTNIVITGGGGAGQPAITSGFIVLEWLTNVDRTLG